MGPSGRVDHLAAHPAARRRGKAGACAIAALPAPTAYVGDEVVREIAG